MRVREALNYETFSQHDDAAKVHLFKWIKRKVWKDKLEKKSSFSGIVDT